MRSAGLPSTRATYPMPFPPGRRRWGGAARYARSDHAAWPPPLCRAVLQKRKAATLAEGRPDDDQIRPDVVNKLWQAYSKYVITFDTMCQNLFF